MGKTQPRCCPRSPQIPLAELIHLLALRACLWLIALTLTISLCLTLTSCARTTCYPTADPNLGRLIETRRLDGTVDVVWMRCERRF